MQSIGVDNASASDRLVSMPLGISDAKSENQFQDKPGSGEAAEVGSQRQLAINPMQSSK